MTSPYLEIIAQWPLIVAVVATFLALKFFLTKGRPSNNAFPFGMVTKVLEETFQSEKNERTDTWLHRARNISATISQIRKEPTPSPKLEEISVNLDTYQKD